MNTDCANKSLFPGQKPDEKIEHFIRRHWVSFLPNIFIALFMIILPIAILIALVSLFNLKLSSEINQYLILGFSAYILFIMTFFIVGWIDYYFDVLIITDERLVNIEQNGLFNRHISELDLLRVQNVSTSIKGVVPTFFDYGCVVVQTAGESMGGANARSSDFVMESMPNPNEIAQDILRLHQELVGKRGQVIGGTHGEGEIHPKPPQDPPVIPADDNQSQSESYQETKVANKVNYYPDDSFASNGISPSARQITDEGQLNEGEIIEL